MQHQARYFLDEKFFDSFGQRQAYYLGLLYADGNNYKTNRKNVVRIALHKKDRDILDKFNSDLKHAKPLRANRDLLELEISNKYISDKLLDLGLTPRKTFTLEFPKWLDVSLHSHFIRGYFDGGGSIGFYKPGPSSRASKHYKTARFSIVSTDSFCNSVISIFTEKLNITSSLKIRHKDRNNNTRTIDIGGNLQVKRLLDFIYNNAEVYLDRKYNLYKNFYYGDKLCIM